METRKFAEERERDRREKERKREKKRKETDREKEREKELLSYSFVVSILIPGERVEDGKRGSMVFHT